MPDWLCKIWRVLANLMGKIIDFILQVLERIIDFVVTAVDSVVSELGVGSWLLFAAVGFVIYKVLTKENKNEQQYVSYVMPGSGGETT